MKKDININEILDYIAVEKAPDNLIFKWKAEVALQKERKSIFSVLLRPSIVLPIIFAGFWYYVAVFRKELLELMIKNTRLKDWGIMIILGLLMPRLEGKRAAYEVMCGIGY